MPVSREIAGGKWGDIRGEDWRKNVSAHRQIKTRRKALICRRGGIKQTRARAHTHTHPMPTLNNFFPPFSTRARSVLSVFGIVSFNLNQFD